MLRRGRGCYRSRVSTHPSRITPGPLALALVALVSGTAAAQEQPRVPGELAVESRLVAPCCWTQTLDIHDSELATSLRAEIRARLRAGERPEAIEDRLAARFGERVRAVPRGRDPRGAVLAVVAIGMAAAALALGLALRRWSSRRAAEAPPAERARDAYDDRVSAELHALDEG